MQFQHLKAWEADKSSCYHLRETPAVTETECCMGLQCVWVYRIFPAMNPKVDFPLICLWVCYLQDGLQAPGQNLVVCLLPLWNLSGFLLAKKRQIFMWSDSQELSFLLSGGGTKPAVLRGMNALKSQPAVTAWCDMDVSCGTPCFLSFLFTGRHQQRCGCVYSENIVGCRGTDCGVLKYLQAGGRMVCSPRSHRVRLFRAEVGWRWCWGAARSLRAWLDFCFTSVVCSCPYLPLWGVSLPSWLWAPA